MKISERIQRIMKDKGYTNVRLGEKTGKTEQTLKNTFYRDRHSEKYSLNFANVEELVEAMGCEVIIRDKETGKEY